jgi:hypothetical protein
MTNHNESVLKKYLGCLHIPFLAQPGINQMAICINGTIEITPFPFDPHIGFMAVLQKHEEEHKGQSFVVLLLCLDGHSEQFCNERRLPHAVSFVYSLHLSFSQRVQYLISLQCSRLPSRTRKKPMPGLTRRLIRSMVLFDQVVEIFALSELTRYGKSPFRFQFAEGFGIRRIFVNGDHAGSHGMASTQRFREKALRRVAHHGWHSSLNSRVFP